MEKQLIAALAALVDMTSALRKGIEEFPEASKWGPLIDSARDIQKMGNRLKKFLAIKGAQNG